MDNASAAPPTQNVRVAVRVRPFVAKEKLEAQASCLRVHEKEAQVVIGKDRAFTFDFVYGESSAQAQVRRPPRRVPHMRTAEPGSHLPQVYTEACAPLVAGCVNGYNATVFAYGQTGSGKTFTMGSGAAAGSGGAADTGAAAPAEQRGVIPRVVDGLFDALMAKSDTTDSVVRVSCAPRRSITPHRAAPAHQAELRCARGAPLVPTARGAPCAAATCAATSRSTTTR
jgi:hypothetical protein